MRSCGVIAEYNPFHNGHAYHLEQARQLADAEVVVVIMSGNFLQRGEPAIYSKWSRAETALLHGADLVIELPFFYAVQAADYFAKGGVQLLQALGVDALCFGTDASPALDYQLFGKLNEQKRPEIEQAFQMQKNNGLSYPQQMTAVYRQIFPDWPLDFQSPNHILGMSYAKENARYPKPMRLFPIPRKEASYHQATIENQSFASATAIRQAIFRQQLNQVEKVVPSQTMRQISTERAQSWTDYWSLLKYRLVTTPSSELRTIYQMTEGIEYRLATSAKTANDFQTFIEGAKTKRYTWTRLQRLAVYLLTNSRSKEMSKGLSSPYLRVLAFNQTGRAFLKQQKKQCTLPIITRNQQANSQQVALDIRAGEVYRLADKLLPPQDYGQVPRQIES